MQEFPKILYLGGALDAITAIVHDEEQEAEARANGFASLGEAEPEDYVEALRAEAEALGVKVDKRWKAERLAEEIAKAKAGE